MTCKIHFPQIIIPTKGIQNIYQDFDVCSHPTLLTTLRGVNSTLEMHQLKLLLQKHLPSLPCLRGMGVVVQGSSSVLTPRSISFPGIEIEVFFQF